ncbi:AbrB family transcriptional regulator [Balneatrix alpica]|uniref:AbrB family transcriptional regulator n=1 Tax=Balneatrix alpica TaxID=75684 RepID=UPI0027387152|nr:AbrB family transcriptional regulator [Balneatrix alpica]
MQRGRNLVLVLRTLLLGGLGGMLASWLNWPSAWLLGSLAAVTLAALLGVEVRMPKRINLGIGVLLGVSMGSSVDADIVAKLSHWSGSLLLMTLMLLLLLALLYRFYRHRMAWSREDALFSGTPGNLGIVLTMALETRADTRRIVLVHSVRLLFLVAVVPLLLPLLGLEGHGIGSLQPGAWKLAALTVLLASVGSVLAWKCRLPAPYLLGALAVTLLLKLGLGWQIQLPSLWLSAILLILGTLLGSRFNALDVRQSILDIRAGMGGLLFSLGLSLAGAALAWWLLGIPLLQAILAFAPGGIEVMVMLAMSFDLNPAYVGGHHLFRVLLMSLLVPLVLHRLQRKTG